MFPRIITCFKYLNLCLGKQYKRRHSCFRNDDVHSKDASKGLNKDLSLKKKNKKAGQIFSSISNSSYSTNELLEFSEYACVRHHLAIRLFALLSFMLR